MPAPATVTTPTDTDVVIVRSFDAPRALVWRAHSEPALMKKWLRGPPGWTLSACEIDARVGGKFRNVFTQPGQPGFEVRGVFREVKAPERWVHTEEYAAAGAPETTGGGGEEPAVETMVQTERAVKTTLTMTMHFPSKAARDAAGAGMAAGMEETYRRLDDLVASQALA